jgi:hypothetical protein
MLNEWRNWADRIAEAASIVLPDSEVYVIGSVVRGDFTGGSDIDILIVTERAIDGSMERAKLKCMIEDEANLPVANRMEIHLIGKGEAMNYLNRAGRHSIRLK